MTDFLTRISRAALGLTPVVQVLGAPRYAPGRPVPDAGVLGGHDREVDVPFVALAPAQVSASSAMTPLPHDAPAIETNASPVPREVPAREARERPRDIRAARMSGPIEPTTVRRDRVVKDEAIREQPSVVPPVTTLASSHDHEYTDAADRSGIGHDSVSRRESEIEAVHESDIGASHRTDTDEAVHERNTAIGSPAPKRVTAVVRSVAAASGVKNISVQNTPGNGELSVPANERPAQHPGDEIIEIASPRVAQQSVDEIIEIPSSSRRSGRGAVPAPLPEFRETPSAQPPIVRVTIGRIDVRAAAPPAPPAAPPPAPGPRLSLDDYLRQHSGRSR